MQYGDYNYALKVFSNILENDPKWSEAWNKRATVYFLMSQLILKLAYYKFYTLPFTSLLYGLGTFSMTLVFSFYFSCF